MKRTTTYRTFSLIYTVYIYKKKTSLGRSLHAPKQKQSISVTIGLTNWFVKACSPASKKKRKKKRKKKGNEKKITLSEALAKAYTDSSNHTFIYSTGRGHSTNKINYNFFLVE